MPLPFSVENPPIGGAYAVASSSRDMAALRAATTIISPPPILDMVSGLIDKGLIDKFISELGGILSWAIEGAVLWFQYGLQPPPIITNATNRYFAVENILAAWVEAHCERAPALTATTRDLYRNYAAWAKGGNEFVLSERRFHENLEILLGDGSGDWQHPTTRRHGFKGIALRQRRELPL